MKPMFIHFFLRSVDVLLAMPLDASEAGATKRWPRFELEIQVIYVVYFMLAFAFALAG